MDTFTEHLCWAKHSIMLSTTYNLQGRIFTDRETKSQRGTVNGPQPLSL